MTYDDGRARPQEPAAGRAASSGGPPPPPRPPVEPSSPEPPREEPPAREFEVPYDTGQISKLSTGELLIVHRDWELPEPDEHAAEEAVVERSLYGTVASVSGILGLCASLFIGWAVPLSIAAIVFGVLGVRRGTDDNVRSVVGIVTGAIGTLFSAIWIVYYANVLGITA